VGNVYSAFSRSFCCPPPPRRAPVSWGRRRVKKRRESEIHVVINRRHQGRRTTCELLKNIHPTLEQPTDISSQERARACSKEHGGGGTSRRADREGENKTKQNKKKRLWEFRILSPSLSAPPTSLDMREFGYECTAAGDEPASC
jgi:hypothetical protein